MVHGAARWVFFARPQTNVAVTKWAVIQSYTLPQPTSLAVRRSVIYNKSPWVACSLRYALAWEGHKMNESSNVHFPALFAFIFILGARELLI